MCGDCCPSVDLSRRRFLLVGGVGALAIPLAVVSPAASTVLRQASDGPADIAPRSAWGSDLPPTGPIVPENDVRFLLVHHTAGANSYAADEVPGILRGIYGFHTSPEKGWPDVADNFFVDRYGGIWEGRAGSLDGPVQGDATGGSQGFAQLCCFLGDHSLEPPTVEATASMTALLAFLSDRHGIATAPGTETSFISRGSNLWPSGSEVTTATIAGHRDMSATACPGDFAYSLVKNEFPESVAALRAEQATPPQAEPAVTATTISYATTAVPSTAAGPHQSAAEMATGEPSTAAGTESDQARPVWIAVGVVGLLVAAVLAGLARLHRRTGGSVDDAGTIPGKDPDDQSD